MCNRIKKMVGSCFQNIDTICLWSGIVYILTCILESTLLPELYYPVELVVKLLRYLCYLVFVVKIGHDIISEKKVSLILIVGALLALCSLVFGSQKGLCFLVLVLAGLSTLNIHRFVKCALPVIAFFWTGIVIASMIGLIPDLLFYYETMERHSLGFIYATDVFSVFLLIALMYFFVYGTKAKYSVIAIFCVVTVVLYILTFGRLATILVLAIISLMLAFKLLQSKPFIIKLKNKIFSSKYIRVLCMSVPFLLFLLIVLLVIMYRIQIPIAHTIDRILSNRIRICSETFENYSITLFGEFIEWQGWGGYSGYVDGVTEFIGYNFIDNSYISILFDYGAVCSAAILTGYTVVVKRAFLERNTRLIITLLIVFLWSFIEPYIFYMGRNIFMICLAPLFRCYMIPLPFLTRINKGK